ncbi:hypothetical protein BDF14DRAFT_115205 [Spinellus fusiger]|nr:hypothetical protein BDF14DRAFT_115205 [Spinellus fusiger]
MITDFLAHLNYDFRISPSLLHVVAKLHTGAIIIDKKWYLQLQWKLIVVTRLQIFTGRQTLRHWHHHQPLFMDLYRLQSDSSSAVDIGPTSSCSVHSIHPNSTRILFCQRRMEEFIAIMKHKTISYSPAQSVTSVRQLISGFNHPSTFAMTRASHVEFDSDLLMPCSVFTVCELPHNQRYGSAANSVGKLSSRFLQVLGLSFLKGTPASFESAIESFNAFSDTKGYDIMISQL